MQTLRARYRYATKWGGYHLRIVTLQLNALLTIRQCDAPEIVLDDSLHKSPEMALRAAAVWLERHGCAAVVNGKKQDLTDFLEFKELGKLEVGYRDPALRTLCPDLNCLGGQLHPLALADDIGPALQACSYCHKEAPCD